MAIQDIFGNRFSRERTQPAWRAGDRPEGVTPSQGMANAGLSFTYVDSPIGYNTPDGQFVESETKKMVLRTPTADDPIYREMGVVAKKYEYIQNAEIAASLDSLAQRTGWTFDTAGSLREGRLFFLSLYVGRHSVFGDDYETYLIVSDGKASGRALTVDVVPYRLICANGLRAADKNASIMLKIPHAAGVAAEYTYWLRYIDDLQRAQAGVYERLERFASVKIDDDAARAIIERAYPLPRKNQRLAAAERLAELPELSPDATQFVEDRISDAGWLHDYHTLFAQRRQAAAFELYERFNAGKEHGLAAASVKLPAKTLKKIAGTPYAALQAVTELADWGGATRDKTAASSTLFGSAAEIKRAAWEAAEAFV